MRPDANLDKHVFTLPLRDNTLRSYVYDTDFVNQQAVSSNITYVADISNNYPRSAYFNGTSSSMLLTLLNWSKIRKKTTSYFRVGCRVYIDPTINDSQNLYIIRLCKNQNNYSNGAVLSYRNGKFYIQMGFSSSAVDITSTESPPKGEWLNLEYVASNTYVKLFVNGVEFVSVGITTTNKEQIAATDGEQFYFAIGYDPTATGRNFKGYIEDVWCSLDDTPNLTAYTPIAQLVCKVSGTVFDTDSLEGERRISAYSTRQLSNTKYATTTQSASGVWELTLPYDTYMLTYMSEGKQPITHGPYLIASDT